MCEMGPEWLQQLREKLSRINIPNQEITIFNIGGRGHYENPMSEILSFFLNPASEHGFGDLVLTCLLELLGRADLAPKLISAPQPEYPVEFTNAGGQQSYGRIDILLKGYNYVIAIENKIRHPAINPFDGYVQAIDNLFNNLEVHNRIFCILSPYKPNLLLIQNGNRWEWLDTRSFIKKIWQSIGETLRDHGSSKWIVLIREFLITLEQEVGATMDENQFRSLSSFYGDLAKAARLREKYLLEIKTKIQSKSEEIFESNQLAIPSHPWKPEQMDVVRVYPFGYGKYSENVTFIVSGGDENAWRFGIQFYVNNDRPDSYNGIQSYTQLEAEDNLHVYQKIFQNFEDAFAEFENIAVFLRDHPPHQME